MILHKAYKQLSLILLLLSCLLSVNTSAYAMVGVPTGNEFVPSSVFNPNLAIFAERVADDMYSPNGSHDKWLKRNGFSTTSLIQFGAANTSTALSSLQAVVAHKQILTSTGNRNLYIVAFRGSQEFVDWQMDFRTQSAAINLLNPPAQVHAHAGFYQATMSMLQKERSICAPDFVNCNRFDSIINAGMTGNDIFFIIGHSLGGAMASHYATTLLERNVPASNIMAYTFGAPAIGDLAYMQRYDSTVGRNIHRIRNVLDPVPYVAMPFGWLHIGHEYVLTKKKILTVSEFLAYKASSAGVALLTTLSKSAGNLIVAYQYGSEHKMSLYLSRLEYYYSEHHRLQPQSTFKDFLATASAEEINRYLYLLSLKGQLLDTSTTKIKLERIDTSVKFVNAAFDIAGWFSHVGNIKKIPNPGKMLNLARKFGKSEETVRAIMVLSVMADSMTMGFPQYSSTEKIASKSVLQKFADLTNATAVNAALNSYAGQTLLYVVSKTLSFALEGQGPNAIGRLLASPKKFAAIFKVGLKASKGLSPMSYAADITKIVINIGAATWVTSITNSMNTTLIATEFLDQYLRTYKGDLTAMMAGMGVSIGYGQYGVNDLASVFKTYTRQKNALGTSLREMYGRQDLIDAVLGGGYDEQAAITLVRNILLQHAPLTFRILTPPGRNAFGEKKQCAARPDIAAHRCT